MIVIEESETPDKNWNNRLLSNKSGTIFQTKEYSRYVETELNGIPRFVKFLNSDDEIVGQIMYGEFSRLKGNGKINHILQKALSKFKLIKWYYGPVIFDADCSSEITEEFQKFLLSKNCKIVGNESPLSSETLSNFRKPFTKQTWGTFLIDLSVDIENIWLNLDKHSARKNIERSQNRGVTIKEITFDDLKSYHELLNQTKKKTNSELDFSSTENLWRFLNPVGLTGFLAIHNENIIGGILVSAFNNYVNEWGVARSEYDTKNKLYSQDFLKWHIIKWGSANNFSYYDLSGVNPNAVSEKEKGIFRYKRKWGGKLIEFTKCNL